MKEVEICVQTPNEVKIQLMNINKHPLIDAEMYRRDSAGSEDNM